MTCPECGTENRDSAEGCASCGVALALPPGTVLADRYEIKNILGIGGLGRVYCAHDRMLDETVAVKVLHPEAARSPELSRRFRSEIKLARKVRHKNVCAIHEYGEHEGYRFVAMELVDGVDLHRVLREQGPLPPRETFDIIIEVTKGLSAIHGAGVLHRDLKTPNIMRDPDGHVRLLDFGIAKHLLPTDSLVTAAQKVVGTPEYMSPEQIRGDDLDERSDIYGLGVVIYELFTGTVPFQGKNPIDTLVKHMNTPPPLYGSAAKHLPASILPVLRRCLAKRSEERYSSARELLGALRIARTAEFPDAGGEAPITIETNPLEGLLSTPSLETAQIGGIIVVPEATPPPAAPASRPPPPPTLPSMVGSRPVTLPSPPTGPPRNPRAGAPPMPSRLTPSEVEASERASVIVDRLQPPGAPRPPEDAAARPRGAGLGAGLALLGLLAVVGALLWKDRQRADTPPTPPTTSAAAAPTPGAAPPVETPADPPLPSPSTGTPPAVDAEMGSGPLAASSPPAITPLPAPTVGAETTLPPAATPTTLAPEPTPKRKRLAATPLPIPSPTAVATPTPVPTVGTLDLEAKPPVAVEIDGQPAGSSPLAARELPVGRHVLKLSHPDYWPITRLVSVEPGRSLRLDLDLAWEAVPRARSREAPYVTPIEGSPSDPYFERGLKQMGAGDFQEALLTLEPVARRLQAAGKGKELARAEFYLAVALLELNRQASARERFQKALKCDESLKAPTGFSPKVTSVFAAVRDTLKKKP